jgi:hypothetical protein
LLQEHLAFVRIAWLLRLSAVAASLGGCAACQGYSVSTADRWMKLASVFKRPANSDAGALSMQLLGAGSTLPHQRHGNTLKISRALENTSSDDPRHVLQGAKQLSLPRQQGAVWHCRAVHGSSRENLVPVARVARLIHGRAGPMLAWQLSRSGTPCGRGPLPGASGGAAVHVEV